MRNLSFFLLLLIFTAKAQWTLIPCPSKVNLTSVHFGCDSVGFIVGRDFPSLTHGTLLRTDNRGAQWTQLDSGAYNSIHCVNKDTFFAARPSVICNSFDGGETITTYSNTAYGLQNNAPDGQYFSVYTLGKASVSFGGHVDLQPPASGSNYSLRKGNITCYRNFYGGTPSTTDFFPTITGICFVDSMNGYFCGTPCFNANVTLPGNVYKTTDGGQNWMPCVQTYSVTWNSIFFLNTNIGYVASVNGEIRKTIDGGYHWTQIYYGGINIKSIHFADVNNGCAVGDNGLILGTKDGGTTWMQQYSGTHNRLRSVYFTSPTTGYIVGDNGTILKTTNGTVGMKENDPKEIELFIYPNPVTDKLFLSTMVEGNFKISDVTGREILSERISKNEIDVSALEKGIYLIKLQSEKGSVTKKVIKE